MTNIPNVYFAVLDIPKMAKVNSQEVTKEFDMSDLPDSGPDRTYVTGKNDDNDYMIFVMDIPTTAKKLFKFKAKRVLRPMFRHPNYIMEKLDKSVRALIVYEELPEVILHVPENLSHYRIIFDIVINTVFKIESKRYDPETGEAIIHVKPAFEFDDVKVEDIEFVNPPEGSEQR